MRNIIQRSVYPNLFLSTEVELYFRLNEFAHIDFKRSLIFLSKMGKARTDTYFNSISVGKWKRYTNISNLSFNIRFKGKIKIKWFLHRLHFSLRFLDEIYLENNSLDTFLFPLDFWASLEDGMLAFEIEAFEDSEIYSFSYETYTELSNPIILLLNVLKLVIHIADD